MYKIWSWSGQEIKRERERKRLFNTKHWATLNELISDTSDEPFRYFLPEITCPVYNQTNDSLLEFWSHLFRAKTKCFLSIESIKKVITICTGSKDGNLYFYNLHIAKFPKRYMYIKHMQMVILKPLLPPILIKHVILRNHCIWRLWDIQRHSESSLTILKKSPQKKNNNNKGFYNVPSVLR